MKISRIRTRKIGFSRAAATLRCHLVTNTSHFDDFEARQNGWLGPVMCTLVEVESDDSAGLSVIPHSSEAHNAHIIFSRPSHVCPLVKCFPSIEPDIGNKLLWKLFAGLPEAENGNLSLADAPGPGMELRHDAVARPEVKGSDKYQESIA